MSLYNPLMAEYFKLINFPKNQRKVSGVYKIGKIYVGASQNIYKRLLQHLRLTTTFRKHSNPELRYYINYCLSIGKKIEVRFLSDDPFEEEIHSKKHGIVPPEGARFYHTLYKKKYAYSQD